MPDGPKTAESRVAGSEPGSKLEKAKALGVQIIEEKQLEALLTQTKPA